MSSNRRDALAAQIAAQLAATEWSAERIAARAYAVADALLAASARAASPVHELVAIDELDTDSDPRLHAPPHEPRWELEPRWTRREREALERARASLYDGPGLASARPDAGRDPTRQVS